MVKDVETSLWNFIQHSFFSVLGANILLRNLSLNTVNICSSCNGRIESTHKNKQN